jgi:pimeloyl-ACP methyl ester carboxylesterase
VPHIHTPAGQVETAWWGPGPGEAPTLVLLHEGLGCIDLWRDVPEKLAAMTGCGVFAYSRLGYGQSDLVTLPRTLTYMQDEARTVLPLVLAAAGIQRTVLVGHSDGGSIATVYAGLVGRNSALLGLVTIAAHVFVEDLNIASIQQIQQSYKTGDLRTRLARYHRDPDVAFHGWSGAWLDPGFRSFNLTGFLPEIAVPILALQGADDPYGTDEQLRVMAAHVRAPIKTVMIPGARHAPHLEAKETTLRLIADFTANAVREKAA